jgi:hypothetical protein
MVDALSVRLADRIGRKILSQFHFRELHPSTLLQREAQAEAAAYARHQVALIVKRAPSRPAP